MPDQTPPHMADPWLDKLQGSLELLRRYGILVFIPVLIATLVWRESYWLQREVYHDEKHGREQKDLIACKDDLHKEVEALRNQQFLILREIYESQSNQDNIRREIREAVTQLQKSRR
jgi:hypothetical protein